jgi:hypothetical protein
MFEGAFNRLVEATVTLVVVYLILANSDGFAAALSAFGNTYSQSVKTLQGR